MRKESSLSLLILCAILSQGNAVISREEIEKSADIHVRNKRVINRGPGGIQPAHITMSRHLVQILVADTFECAGNILQSNIILTIRLCLYGSNDQYTVLSGSLTKYNGTRHHVIGAKKHPLYNLALLKISPPIVLSPHGNNKISLFTGSLPPNPSGLFSGWGCTNILPTGERIFPHQLMSTILPIITLQQCRRAIERSHRFFPIIIDLCTLDESKERGACFGDEGGSLVYGGRLLGIFSNIREVNLGVHPDIFINVHHAEISPWIVNQTRELERMYPN